MKKILYAVVLLAFIVIVTSCGINTLYYNLGSKNVYYYDYVQESTPIAIEIDPYDFLKDKNEWLKNRKDIKWNNARANDPKRFYDVVVEYRVYESHNRYQELELKDGLIVFENPHQELGNNSKYEFRIHFLDKETQDKKTMINYYVVYTFKKSPINPEYKEITILVNESYTLLDNVVEYSGENRLTYAQLLEKYNVQYKIYRNGELLEIEVENDTISFESAGTYEVVILLTAKSSGSNDNNNNDGNSGATPSGNDAESGASTQADANSSASESGGNDGSSGATPQPGENTQTGNAFEIRYTIKVTEE